MSAPTGSMQSVSTVSTVSTAAAAASSTSSASSHSTRNVVVTFAASAPVSTSVSSLRLSSSSSFQKSSSDRLRRWHPRLRNSWFSFLVYGFPVICMLQLVHTLILLLIVARLDSHWFVITACTLMMVIPALGMVGGYSGWRWAVIAFLVCETILLVIIIVYLASVADQYQSSCGVTLCRESVRANLLRWLVLSAITFIAISSCALVGAAYLAFFSQIMRWKKATKAIMRAGHIAQDDWSFTSVAKYVGSSVASGMTVIASNSIHALRSGVRMVGTGARAIEHGVVGLVHRARHYHEHVDRHGPGAQGTDVDAPPTPSTGAPAASAAAGTDQVDDSSIRRVESTTVMTAPHTAQSLPSS